jgi:AMMECR1 domain-containing protein
MNSAAKIHPEKETKKVSSARKSAFVYVRKYDANQASGCDGRLEEFSTRP